MRSASQDAGFFAFTGVVRFQLIQGRLCLDAPRHRKGSQNRDEDGIYESITVTAERGIPSMHYVCQTPDHHLTLSVQKADSLRIESWFPKSSERSVLEQPVFGEITWTHQRGDLKVVQQGATLLHLRQSDPVSFDTHYGLLVERLLRGQSLRNLSALTQSKMLKQIGATKMPDSESIHDCIDRLRSKRRSTRIAAERQLLAWGTPIIPTIHQLSAVDMDGEQADRLRNVLRRLRPRVDDTPSTLAKLLVNDPSYWSAIAVGLSSDELRLANHHMEEFGCEGIIVPDDPAERIAASTDVGSK
jgi:hypothetical protein